MKDQNSDYYLGLNGYRGAHSHITRAIEVAQAQGTFDRVTYRWMGEIHLRNDLDYEAPGKIVAASEVASKYIDDLHDRDDHTNQVQTFRKQIKRHFSKWLDEHFTQYTFEQSVARNEFHLFPNLDTFISVVKKIQDDAILATVARLEARGQLDLAAAELRKIDRRTNYRHFINTKLAILRSNLETDFENGRAEERGEEQTRTALALLLNTDLGFEALYLAISWYENDGIAHPCIDVLKRLLWKFKMESLTIEEWKEFSFAIEEFHGLMEEFGTDSTLVRETFLFKLVPG